MPRIGVVTQTLTSVGSLRKSTRKSYLFRAGKHLILPTLLGSLAGGWLGSSISAEGMEWSLAVVMLGMAGTLFWKTELPGPNAP